MTKKIKTSSGSDYEKVTFDMIFEEYKKYHPRITRDKLIYYWAPRAWCSIVVFLRDGRVHEYTCIDHRTDILSKDDVDNLPEGCKPRTVKRD